MQSDRSTVELVILIGLQASGKSTFSQKYFAETHAYVSKDRLRKNKARSQARLLEEALQAGRSVIVDNTNVTRAQRSELIDIGKRYGARIVGYYFKVQVKRSLERNKQRTGKECVPDIGIFATLKRLEHPSYREGYDALYYVRSLENFTFEITDWREEEPQ
jgi:predicted kinase